MKKILIFTRFGMGDFIMATSAISLINNYDKNIKISIIMDSSYSSLVDKSFNIDKLILRNCKYYFHRNIIIQRIYKIYWLFKLYINIHKFETLVYFDHIPSTFVKFAKKVCKIKNIIGPNDMWYNYIKQNPNTKYNTKTVIMPKNSNKNHWMMRHQILIRSIFPTYNLAIPVLPNTSYLSNKINMMIGSTKKVKVALCTQGNNKLRCLKKEYTIFLISKLNELSDISFFILGNTQSQKIEADNIIKSIKNIDIRNMCKRTSVLELKEFLRHMDLLISVDTGVIHLAATANIPMFVFHYCSSIEQTGAISYKESTIIPKEKCFPCYEKTLFDNNFCNEPKCIYNISIDNVLTKIKEVLFLK